MIFGISKFYFSKQHGAYITLITSWLIAVLLSDSIRPIQFLVLLFLLSLINSGELITEKFKRKSPLPHFKKFWLSTYVVITLISGIIISMEVKTFPVILPIIGLSGILFIFLSVKRLQKSIIAEWLVFFMFSMAGLLALNPENPPDTNLLFKLGLIMGIYFGNSIFVVKARLGKISPIMALLYVMAVTVILSFLTNNPVVFFLISAILFIKIIPPVFLLKWYSKLKIRNVGFMEIGYNCMFIIVLIAFWR